MRYVELLGLPGAGKTTLLRRWNGAGGFSTLPQLVRRQRIRSAHTHHGSLARLLPDPVKLRVLRGPEPDFYDAAAFIAAHPALHDLVMECARELRPRAARVDALWMLLEACARYHYGQRLGDPGEGLVVDEGILQRLAFVLAATGRVDAVTRLRREEVLPGIDGLIHLALPLESAVSRVLQRGAEFQRTDVMPVMAAVLHDMVDAVRAIGVPVLTIDASRPREQSLEQVHEFLTLGAT